MLAAVFGILSALLMFAFLNSRGGDGSGIDKALQGDGTASSIVVVAKDIKVGQEITSDMLTSASVPTGLQLTGHFADTKDIVGKVATAPMFAGEQVLAAKVTTFEGQTTLSYKVPAGMRALGLMVPHEAWIVGGLPQPGDRVDVVGITTLTKTDPLTGKDVPDITAGIIAQDIEVLAVGQHLVKFIPNTDTEKKAAQGGSSTGDTTGAAASASPSSDGSGASTDPSSDTYEKSISVTLALSPELAAKVAIIDAMKDDEAQWRLIVRKKGEDDPISGQQSWTLDDAFTFNKKK
jgi:Flp pilus assembly protein CpaB